ncbi:MAG: autotransporter domain-containing protein [Elusimicrobiota bacterium]|nr:autotransporter domain-containing protein [Elusimicrobiota bacterium]
MSNNTARTGSGGALYLDRSNLTVNGINKKITFSANKALTAYGGAIYMSANSANFSDSASIISFTNNTALDGAAVYAISNAKLLFANETLEFEGNNSINGNGIIYLDGSSSLDLSKTLTLKAKNNQGANGGFLYLSSKGSFDINGNIEMNGNISRLGYGGSFYFNATDLNLNGENKNIRFLNHNTINGGAIYIANANFNIGAKNSVVSFINNTAQKGAAIYTYGSQVIFKNGYFEFIGNNSINSNSIIELSNGSNLSFNNISNLKAVNNQSNNGGFLYLSNISLNINSETEISNNTARVGSGGALYLDKSNLTINGINKKITFGGNKALAACGGVIYITDANLDIGAKNSIVSFINNTAQKGAAIYADKSSIVFKDADIEFINNNSINSNSIIELSNGSNLSFNNISNLKAVNNQSNNGGFLYLSNISLDINNKIEISSNTARKHSGGAIYGRKLLFKAKGGIFANNYAKDSGGALYAAHNSELVFKDISFLQNLAGKFGGAIFLNNSKIEISADKNDVFFEGNKAKNENNDIYMQAGSILSLYSAKNKKIVFLGGIITDNNSEIFKTGDGHLSIQGNSRINSKITISNGLVSTRQEKLIIGKLILESSGIYNGEKHGKNVYKTLVGDAEIYGTIGIASDFTSNQSDMVIASTRNADGAQGKILIGTSSYLIIDGDRIHTIGYSTMTIFEANEIIGTFNLNSANIKNIDYRLEYYPNRIDLIIRRWSDFAEMEGLSKNQKEIALLLDNISKDYKTTPKNMNDIISDIYFIDSQENKLKYIDKLSGVFIANLLNTALDYDDIGNIYQRLNRDSFSDISNQIWLQTGALSKNYNTDDNSNERFSYNDYSIAGGVDIYKTENLMLGAYLKYDDKKFKQEKSRAKSNNYEIGAYGMKEFLLNRNSIFLKADLAFGFQNYSLNRNIELVNKTYSADSSFRTNIAQSALQGEYIYNEYFSFFAGLNSVFLTNPNIKEKNGEWIGLEISNGTNIRISGIFGANAASKYKKLKLNVKVYGKPILSGADSKIKVNFLQSDIGQKSEISSVKEGFSAGIFGNVEYTFSNSISVFFNNDLNISEPAFAYSFNIGVNYKLPIKTSLEISEIEDKFKKARKLFNKQKYLMSGDLLSEIIAENPDFMQTQELFKKTNSYMEYNLDKGNIEEQLYAKAYFSYFDKDYSDACEQWYKYIQYKNDNEEVADYYNKISALLKSNEDNTRKEASSEKAERLFKNAVDKFNKMLWTVCIKDMEKLQDFVQKEKLNNASAYNKKAKNYIDACIKQLSLSMQEIQEENQSAINEEEAETKYNEGLALYSDGKYLEAQRAWELTLRLNPNHKKAKTALSNLEKSGHISK